MKQIFLQPSPQTQWGDSKGSGEPSDASVNWTHLFLFFPPRGCWGRGGCGRWSNGTAVGRSGASIQSCSGGEGDLSRKRRCVKKAAKILLQEAKAVNFNVQTHDCPKTLKFLLKSFEICEIPSCIFTVAWANSYFIWSVTCTDLLSTLENTKMQPVMIKNSQKISAAAIVIWM